MQNVRETELAWALTDAATPHLSTRERDAVFVIIGAGDTFAVIRRLLELAVAKHIRFRTDLVHRCSMWLDTYARHEQEHYLRRLIAAS
jgi:hypothetical protein